MDAFDWQSFFLDPEIVPGHVREAKFSIFDSPEEVEKAIEEDEAAESVQTEGKWNEFLDLFYEGGKKKVDNPNPKTKKKYPEVQVSTALKEPTFAGKVKKEYEAWLSQGQPSPAEVGPAAPKDEEAQPKPPPAPEPKVGDKIKSTDQIQPGMYLKNPYGIVGKVTSKLDDGGFKFRPYDWKTGKFKGVKKITKSHADDFFKSQDFTVVEDPALELPEGSQPTNAAEVSAGDTVWLDGEPHEVQSVEPDEDKFGSKFKLDTGKWVNQMDLDKPDVQGNYSHVYAKPGEPKKKEEKAEKPDEDEMITTSDQLEAGDWIESQDPDDPSETYVGKVVEVVSSGVMLQDFNPTTGKLLGNPWLLKEGDIAKAPTKKIEAPKVKKPLAGKPVKDLKSLKAGDVLRSHRYDDGSLSTAIVAGVEAGKGVHLAVHNPKTGKLLASRFIPFEGWEDKWQLSRLPASKVPKKLKEPAAYAAKQDQAPPVEDEPKPEEPKPETPKGKTKKVDKGKWKLKRETVPFDDIKKDDVVHTKEFGPQRIVERTHNGVRLESGVVLTKSKLEKEKGDFVVSRGDKPQKPKTPEPPPRPKGQPVTSPDQVDKGDVIEYEHNGVTYRGEVVSWDTPGEKFRVRIIYPPEKLDKYQQYDPDTGDIKYKTPSFDFEKIKKRDPRILTKQEMKDYDAAVKKYTQKLKEIDTQYAQDVAEYEAAMAGKEEVAEKAGPLKNIKAPKEWNHGSTIARDADRFFDQYKEIIGKRAKNIADGMAAGQSYWDGPSPLWDAMSEGERKLAQSAYMAASLFNELLTSDERAAWDSALDDWQGSSGAAAAHRLMGALETLGVEGGPKYFETANVQHYREDGRENEALHRAISKAMAFSQLMYDLLDVDSVSVYRGTKTKPVQGAPQGKKIKTTTARELASFSIDPSVAYSFASGGNKRVVRYKVPASRLFISPMTYKALASNVSPHSENEYVVVGQDGMEGQVMPVSRHDFDKDKMKLASAEDEDDVLIISFSEYEEDWLRPWNVEQWWGAGSPPDEEGPPPRVGARILALAQEHAGFRRELIAALRPKRAAFSIFDEPEEVEQKSSPDYGKMTFESWFDKRYEGGKKKVKNPNPETKERYPEITVSTAMKTPSFAKKVYSEYQQEMRQAQPPKKAPRPPDEVEPGAVLTWDEKDLGRIEREVQDVYQADDGRWVVKDDVGVEWNYTPEMEVKKEPPGKKDPVQARKVIVDDVLQDWPDASQPLSDLEKRLKEELGDDFSDEHMIAALEEVEDHVQDQYDSAKEDEANPEQEEHWKSDLYAVQKRLDKLRGEPRHIDIDSGEFEQVGAQAGSNPGGLYEAEDGTRYYVKTPANEDRARNEILAGKLYQLADIDVPELYPATRSDKFSVASKIIPGLKRSKSKLTKGGVPGVAEGIAVDAWLANWDVVGLEHDNLLIDEQGHGKRVDTGGALRYRAMGDPKGDKFGPTVTELDVFTDKSRRAGGVLGHATPRQIVESIDRVLEIPESKIRDLVEEWGPKSEGERKKLLDTLLARRESLKKQREKFAEKVKQKTARARRVLAMRRVLREPRP